LIDCVTSSYAFAMCGEVGEEWGFLGGKEPTSWVTRKTKCRNLINNNLGDYF